MPRLFDLVKVNTPTTGTGTVTFGSVFSPEFFAPSEVGAADSDTVRYVLIDGTDIELGTGVIGGSVTTMTRTVVRSRIGGVAGTSKISLSGTAYLALTAAAADILNPANNLADLASTSTALTNLGGTSVGKALFTAASAAAARVTLGIGTNLYNLLGADVNLNNTSNFFDGPSISQGSSGTWFVIGKATVRDTSAAASFLVKLWDGTTVVDSAVFNSAGANLYACCTLFGIITSPAGNLKVSVKDLTSTSGIMRVNASLEGRDSSIAAFRLA